MARPRQPRILDFLLHLADNPSKLAAYKTNRRRVMNTFGLTAAQQDALLTNDPRQIEAAVVQESGQLPQALRIVIFYGAA